MIGLLVPDFETKLMLGIINNVTGAPNEIQKLEEWVRDRAEMIRSGVLRCPSWFQEELNKLDSKLRCWWDSQRGEWVIDRLQDAATAEFLERAARDSPADEKGALLGSAAALAHCGAYYITVMHFKPEGQFQLNRALIEMLRENDMARYSPAEYQAFQEERAAKIRKANEQAGMEKIMTVVDNMSPTQIKNFLEVAKAVETGETVIPHGEDLKILERMQQGADRAQRIDPMTAEEIRKQAI